MVIITKGYLLHREDYGDFDEIIIFINEHGNKFTCISKGSRRITSKNNYHLNYGNYAEFEFFYSEENMSKLKKVHTLSYLPENTKLNLGFFLINEIYYQIELGNKKWFTLYQALIFNILKDYNEFIIMMWLCVAIYTYSGLKIDFHTCYICQSKLHLKSVEFSQFHAVCQNCFNQKIHFEYDKNALEVLSLLQENKIKIETIKNIDIKKLTTLLKGLIIFVANNLGIYIDTAKWF